MIDFGTVFAGVAIGNVVSIAGATYVNSVLAKRDAKRRRELLDISMAKFEEELNKASAPEKKAAKKVTQPRTAK